MGGRRCVRKAVSKVRDNLAGAWGYGKPEQQETRQEASTKPDLKVLFGIKQYQNHPQTRECPNRQTTRRTNSRHGNQNRPNKRKTRRTASPQTPNANHDQSAGDNSAQSEHKHPGRCVPDPIFQRPFRGLDFLVLIGIFDLKAVANSWSETKWP